MNKLFIRLLVAFVAFSFGLILTNIIKPVRSSERVARVRPVCDMGESLAEAEIRQIYSEYGPAQTVRDRAFFERIETEDFTLTIGNRKLTREEDIQWMEEQSTDRTYSSNVDHLKIFGRLAVAHGYLEVRDANGLVKNWAFVDVWIKRNDTWQIQSTVSQ